MCGASQLYELPEREGYKGRTRWALMEGKNCTDQGRKAAEKRARKELQERNVGVGDVRK